MDISKQIEEKLKHISVCRKEQTNDEQSFKELTKLYSEALTLSYQSTEVKDIRNVFYRFAGFIEKSAYKYNFFQHIEETLEVAQKGKYLELEIQCLCLKGRECFRNDKRKMALEALQEAQAKNRNPKVEIKILLYFALISKEVGQYQKAIDFLTKVGAIYEKEDWEETREMASYYNTLATVYRYNKRYDRAFKYHQKALSRYKSLKYEEGIAIVYNNIGILHERKFEYEEALKNLNKALQLKKKLNMPISTTLTTLGNVYLEQMELEKAEKNYLASLEIIEKTQDTKQIIGIKNALGRLYVKQKKYIKGEEILKKCEQEAIEKKFDNLLEKNYLALEELYEVTKNYEAGFRNAKALRYISQKIQDNKYRESLIINDTLSRMRDKEIEIKNQKQKTDEVKHRVKNHFSVLLGLIEQLKRQHPEQLSIEKIENCIHAMAELNQILYNVYVLKPTTNLADFLENLTIKVEEVLQNLYESSRRIEIKNNLDKSIYLNSSSCLDLGLVVSEIITNSYKYAFNDFEDTEIPLINIDLIKNEEKNNIILEIKDNGCGLKKEDKNKKSFGTTFIENYIKQLDGEIIWPKLNDKGTFYRITLPT